MKSLDFPNLSICDDIASPGKSLPEPNLSFDIHNNNSDKGENYNFIPIIHLNYHE